VMSSYELHNFIDDVAAAGWQSIRDSKWEGIKKLWEDKIAPLMKSVDGPGCTLAGSGRGDCEHAVGLPGESIPGQHDGDDDTVDVYGKPNGWCWSCWKDHQIRELQKELNQSSRHAGMNWRR